MKKTQSSKLLTLPKKLTSSLTKQYIAQAFYLFFPGNQPNSQYTNKIVINAQAKP